jgi:WhiB family redox-sensing transcriptional regulator
MARDDRPTKGRVNDWRLHAACRPLDSELFFPDRAVYGSNDVARAKAVCRECPVRDLCLQAAIEGRERVGIWGGLTPQERAQLHRRKRPVAGVPRPFAAKALPERAAITGASYPNREQIRRGVAAGWLRLETTAASTGRETPLR